MLPPGRARLLTNPSPSASALAPMTIGIDLVASLAARVAEEDPVRMMSTLRCTSSVASPNSRSCSPSAYRDSKRMFCPSTHPRSRNTLWNAANCARAISALLGERNPTQIVLAAFGPARVRSNDSGARNCANELPASYHSTTLRRRLLARRLPVRKRGAGAIGIRLKYTVALQAGQKWNVVLLPSSPMRTYCFDRPAISTLSPWKRASVLTVRLGGAGRMIELCGN